MDDFSLFTHLDEPPLSSVSEEKMFSILPFLPERGYVGTKTDRKTFIILSKSCNYRPAYMIRAVGYRRNAFGFKPYSFYTVIPYVDSFRHAKEKAIFNHFRNWGREPEIKFMARLATILD